MRLSYLSFILPLALGLMLLPRQLLPAAEFYPDLVYRYTVGDLAVRNPVDPTEGPKAFAVGDLNQDNRPDVVVGNLDGSISILLAKPVFFGLQPQILVPATGVLSNSSLRGIALADFNHDGRLDVAAGDIGSAAGLLLLLGNGDGTFASVQRQSLGPVRALAAADFNRDGHPDLLVACGPKDCEGCCGNVVSNRFLCVLRGNGDGTFQEPLYVLTPGPKSCFYDVSAADINRDGFADASVLDFANGWRHQVMVFTNNGAGGFTTNMPQQTLVTAGMGPRAFQVAYLDEFNAGTNPPPEASLDIVVACRDSRSLDIFLNRGGADFIAPHSVPVGDRPRDVAAADLDQDGFNDLVVVNRMVNSISVLKGLGGGQFSSPSMDIPTGVSPRQVVLADFDQDGQLDAVVNNRMSEDISVFRGQSGLLGFLLPQAYFNSGQSPVSIVARDFNGDGHPDVAVANLRSHDVRVRLNQGDATFGPEIIYPVNYEPAFLEVGDLNGDGRLDLLVSCLGQLPVTSSNYAPSLVVLLGKAGGAFEPPIATPLGNTALRPYWLRLADLSGDAIADAVVGGLGGELVVFQGNGNGTFRPGLPVGLQRDGLPLGIAVGDFDRNGWPDIATSRGKVFLNDGQFFSGLGWTNETWTGRTTSFNAGLQAWATETDDMDGDGNLDLMVAITFERPDPIVVFYGNGDGTFGQSVTNAGPDIGVTGVTAVDVNGDGRKDLVIGNRCAATVLIMTALTNRQFELAQIVHTPSVEDIAITDLNSDGKPDIVGAGIGLWSVTHGGTNSMGLPHAAGAQAAPGKAGVCINEIMALNKKFHLVNTRTPDWIELFNSLDSSMNIAGWSLVSIESDITNRWSFPPLSTIGPRGHLLVYCERDQLVLPGLVANFQLSAEGQILVLQNALGVEIDRVNFPAMPEDNSYARYPDGARFFSFTPAPTIATGNLRPANLNPSVELRQPYVSPAGGRVGINARAFDDVAIAFAAIGYRLQGAQGFVEQTLADDGRSEDKEPGDNYFGIMLPAFPPGSVIEYYLRVVDLEGQVDMTPGDLSDASQLYRLTVPPENSPLRLVEVMADNQTGLLDEFNTRNDWVELFNSGSNRVSLDGLALTTDYLVPTNAWYFPSGWSLDAGARLTVFCDGRNLSLINLHTSFKVKRSGDRIFLVQSNGWLVLDSLSYGAMPADVSLGVLGKGTNAQMLLWPTPGAENVPLPAGASTAMGSRPQLSQQLIADLLSGVRQLRLRWLGPTNVTWQAEWSMDLRHWTNVLSPLSDLGQGVYQYDLPATNDRPHFLRLNYTPK